MATEERSGAGQSVILEWDRREIDEQALLIRRELHELPGVCIGDDYE